MICKILTAYFPLLFFCAVLQAQNIVPNASFEQYQTCPSALSQFTNYCSTWYAFTIGTPDYFNACSKPYNMSVPDNVMGSQYAAGGKAYAGLLAYTQAFPDNYKEYIAAPISSVEPGRVYKVSMSVSLAGSSGYATNNLGIWFYRVGDSFIATNIVLPVTPQVSYSATDPSIIKQGGKDLPVFLLQIRLIRILLSVALRTIP